MVRQCGMFLFFRKGFGFAVAHAGDVTDEFALLIGDANLDRGDLMGVLSSYRAPDGTKFWIITEWDRSYTTVLLPEEY